jgi:acyl carrier protein
MATGRQFDALPVTTTERRYSKRMLLTMDVQTRVLEFFIQNARNTLPADDDGLLSCAYLDSGVIDSLGIVLLLDYVESHFEITMTAEDLQSADFQTVGGLISLIRRKVDSQKDGVSR